MELNTFLLIAVSIFMLWLAGTGRLGNVIPAWHILRDGARA